MAAQSTGDPSGSFTEPTALKALVSACQEVGLDGGSAQLIRMGSNAVFRLDPDTIARVAPSPELLDNARKQIDVARWLESIGYLAVRAIDVQQPVEAKGRVTTSWRSVASETAYAPISDVATLIKRLHDLTSPEDLKQPPPRPVRSTSDPLPDIPGLSDADEQYLHHRIERARDEFPSLRFVLPPGVILVDADVGNVLVDTAGQAVVIDLDSLSEIVVAPSATATAISTNTRPGSWRARGLRNPVSALDSSAVSVVRSATSATNHDPACDTTPESAPLLG